MQKINHQSELENLKYRNWVRGGLAFKYLKEGIQGFADKVVQEEHNRILKDVSHTQVLACNQCCPNRDAIREQIRKSHASKKPNWTNTDEQKWCNSPWEVAKCYIHTNGYLHKTQATDIDITGLLHVFINNTNLHSRLSCSMTGENIFIETRKRRNDLFHSPTLEMEEKELNKCIDGNIAILEDPEVLKASDDAKYAVSKLKELKHQDFRITTHNEVEVCRYALAYVANKSEELKQTIQDIEMNKSEATEDIQKALQDALKVLASNIDIPTLCETVKLLNKRVEKLESNSSAFRQEISSLKQCFREIKNDVDILKAAEDKYNERLKYVNEKKVLQERLVELYQTRYVGTSVSPLKSHENDLNIKEVYVAPEMVVKERIDRNAPDLKKKPNTRALTGYQEMLQTNGQKHKQIYIVGDVGTGKSTFCKMMIQDWCTAINEESPTSAYNDELKDPHKSAATEKNVDPVSDKDSTPVSDNDEVPSSDNDDPVSVKDSAPVSVKDSAPVSDKDSAAVSVKGSVSVSDKDFAPVSVKDSAPVSVKDSSPVSVKDSAPVSDKDSASVSVKDSAPISVKDSAPVSDKDSAPVNVKDSAPVSDKDSAPVSVKDSAPVGVKDSAPVSDKESAPVSVKDPAPVSDKDSAHVSVKGPASISNKEYIITANDENINEMRNFDFLFFVSLQRITKQSDIIEMIKAIATKADLASTDLIDRIFQQESERCLVVVDGLDEWTPLRTKSILPHVSCGLPERDKAKHATVITLSRPSAIGILNMKSSECDQTVQLLGINSTSVGCFIDKYLSKFRNTDLSCREFMEKVKMSKLEHLEKTPLLLQQLVWLYVFGYEIGKSVSYTYCHLVNVMLGWLQNKEEGTNMEKGENGVLKQDKQQLPSLLRNFARCEANKRILLSLASVAYEALTSETRSNTFGRSYLQTLGMSEDAITSLIKLGILTEENCFDPTCETTMLEFIHISYLEFFAAVHVSGQYNKDQCSIHQKNILEELFRNCKSAADILQLSNVIKMICGLSPYIISELSKMIADIVARDERMKTCRSYPVEYIWNTSSHELELIQRLMFNCLSEGDSDEQQMICLCDITIDHDTKKSFLQRIIPEKVLYLNARVIEDVEVWGWIVQLKQLEYLHIYFSPLSHNESVLLSAFIQEASLRCLSLRNVYFTQSDCEDHRIDLSKHDQLRKLELVNCHRVVISNINTKHLEKLRLASSRTLDIDLLLNASSLAELQFGSIYCRTFTYSNQVDSDVHTLRQLRKLRIVAVNIDTNALTVTPEMRNLEHIELRAVSMSKASWRTFVDSLLTLQQSVQVVYSSDKIDDDKRNYVRQNKMFEVMDDSRQYFKFRTKK